MSDQFDLKRISMVLEFIKERETAGVISSELATEYQAKALDELLSIIKNPSLDSQEQDSNTTLEAAAKPVVFICYAPEDNEDTSSEKRCLNRLLNYLKPLKLQDRATIWSAQDIELGEDRHESIQATLRQVRAVVLLISTSFLNSEYLKDYVIPVLLTRAKDRSVVILPIIVRRCLLETTMYRYPHPEHGPNELSLKDFEPANPLESPLIGMKDHEQDEIINKVAQSILSIVNENAASA
jgi:TIR domain